MHPAPQFNRVKMVGQEPVHIFDCRVAQGRSPLGSRLQQCLQSYLVHPALAGCRVGADGRCVVRFPAGRAPSVDPPLGRADRAPWRW